MGRRGLGFFQGYHGQRTLELRTLKLRSRVTKMLIKGNEVEGNDVFVAFPSSFGSLTASDFHHMRGTEGSIALVVSPMMEQ